MGKLLSSILISRVLNIIRNVFVLSLLSDQMIVYYEYFKQILSSNKFTDTGFVSTLERDFNDESRKVVSLIGWGIVFEVVSLSLIVIIVYHLSRSSNWDYHEFIFYIIFLMVLVKLKRTSEAVIIINKDKVNFRRQLILSALLALLLFLVFHKHDIIAAIFISNMLFFLTPTLIAIFIICIKKKIDFTLIDFSIINLVRLTRYCAPIFFLGLSSLMFIVSERIYVQNISESFSISFASYILLVSFINLFTSTLLRFERQRLNLLERCERKEFYVTFVLNGLKISLFMTACFCALVFIIGSFWPLLNYTIPVINNFLNMPIAITSVLLFGLLFTNWVYIVVSKNNFSLWVYAGSLLTTSCLLLISQYFVEASPWILVFFKCLPFVSLMILFMNYISSEAIGADI